MKIGKPNFYIQWHITDRCSQRCRHCYLHQSEYTKQSQKELDINVLSLVVDDMYRTVSRLNANPVFVLTGGDPILHPDFWRVLDTINEFARKFQSKVTIDILGNPFLVNKSTAVRLKTKGVRKYQLSLDGLEKKHDFLRKDGSYKDTFRAGKILRKAGIRTTCMFTLSKFNASDLIGVMKEVTENDFDAFAFARFCKPSSWSVEEYKEQMFTPEEYRSLLEEVDSARKDLIMVSPRTKFVFKDHLWELYFYERYSDKEKRQVNQAKKEKIITGGCGLGIASLSVLSDGTVYACRRFESPIGKVPEQSLFDIFIKSKELSHFRDLALYEKCRNCPLLYACRGCGAVSYGVTNNFFGPDPQCWYSI